LKTSGGAGLAAFAGASALRLERANAATIQTWNGSYYVTTSTPEPSTLVTYYLSASEGDGDTTVPVGGGGPSHARGNYKLTVTSNNGGTFPTEVTVSAKFEAWVLNHYGETHCITEEVSYVISINSATGVISRSPDSAYSDASDVNGDSFQDEDGYTWTAWARLNGYSSFLNNNSSVKVDFKDESSNTGSYVEKTDVFDTIPYTYRPSLDITVSRQHY
jgi:hypothetical protein